MPIEILLYFLVLLVAVGGPLLSIILSIIAILQARQAKRLGARVERLEASLGQLSAAGATHRPASEVTTDQQASGSSKSQPAETVAVDQPIRAGWLRPDIDWERFVGQQALGWAATLLLFLAAAFFLRYAYQNDWIGPLGQVAISALVGCALTIAGQRYDRRGWKVFSQMLTGAGVIVLYLASYSAFEFYHLLPPQHAGVFLALIIVESMVLAVIYNSVAIGLVAVLGGLMTPVLMHTDRDSYAALFTYLALLNAGTMLVLTLRRWPAIGSVALLGTHGLFWSWYAGNYHPEKLDWAVGFHVVIVMVFLAHTVLEQLIRKRQETWEGLLRIILVPAFAFFALYVLWAPDYRIWLGSLALLTASIYAVLAQVTLLLRPRDRRLLLTLLAVSIGFISVAFPIQADSHWVALGWAATALALWWFGQRIAAPVLRLMAGILMGCAVVRVIFYDWPQGVAEPIWPLFNTFALPSSCVAICLLVAVYLAQPYLDRLGHWEKRCVTAGSLIGVLLLWLVLTIDCYTFFDGQATIPGVDQNRMRWLGQLSVSVLWAVYASSLLAIGFRLQRAPLRWLAIAGYGVTILKVLMVDMSSLQQFYRILAFFILAVVLGLATRAYQRLEKSKSHNSNERTLA